MLNIKSINLLRVTRFLIIFMIFLAFNRTWVGSNSAPPEVQINYFIHKVIDSKKAVKADSFFTRRHEMGLFNGVALVAEEGRIVYEKAFGVSDYRSRDSLTIDTPFQLASVSKPLTAYAVLLLYDRGLLSLDDDVKTFFPDFPYDNITVKLLLSHRSGLPNYMYFADKYWPDRHKPISNQDVLNLMVKYHPGIYYLPDRRYNYCNTNYALLANIIEKVSGMPFETFMRKEIFDPLGMYHTSIYNKTRQAEYPEGALGYNRRGRLAENSYLNGVVGDKGIYSTVRDLLAFDQAIYNGLLVSRETLEKAFIPAHKDLRIYDNYGYGWRLNAQDEKNKIVYHTGWWKGFKTYFIRKTGEKKTIIVLTNNARITFLPIKTLSGLI
ncbi:MAG: serine hydrolase domain-containing protein [Calditrichia bacterium]